MNAAVSNSSQASTYNTNNINHQSGLHPNWIQYVRSIFIGCIIANIKCFNLTMKRPNQPPYRKTKVFMQPLSRLCVI